MSMGPPWKRIVQEQLQTLASESEQLEYEQRVPNVDVTAELICGWFDDTYHPNDRAFREAFSPEQLRELETFSTYFEQRISHLPSSEGTVKEWHSSSVWREVMEHAARTLRSIAV